MFLIILFFSVLVSTHLSACEKELDLEKAARKEKKARKFAALEAYRGTFEERSKKCKEISDRLDQALYRPHIPGVPVQFANDCFYEWAAAGRDYTNELAVLANNMSGYAGMVLSSSKHVSNDKMEQNCKAIIRYFHTIIAEAFKRKKTAVEMQKMLHEDRQLWSSILYGSAAEQRAEWKSILQSVRPGEPNALLIFKLPKVRAVRLPSLLNHKIRKSN